MSQSLTLLDSLEDQEDLTQKISLLSPASANAVATTTLQLHDAANGKLNHFLLHKLTLLAPNISTPDTDVLDYLCNLTLAAEGAAVSTSCSSILLGQTSESDYLGDVAIWLGNSVDYGADNARAILHNLELEKWCDQKITPVPLETDDKIPSTVAPFANDPAVQPFVEQVKQLEYRHCFRVRKPGCEGCVVAFLLIGKIQGKGWGGLCGMGTWSDLS